MYSVGDIRKQFPMLSGNKTMQGKPLVYLDNASTTFKPQCVIDAIERYYRDLTANSHRGDYDLLHNMDNEVLLTRKAVAGFVNCDVDEVVFTSGDTMSLNTVAFGYALKFLKEDDEILISEEEHASNVLPWYQVAKYTKSKIRFIPLDEKGRITVNNLIKVISNKTKIVSVAQVSNVLGYVCDVKKIAETAHRFGAVCVVDGAQSVPHMPVDFKALGIDFLTFSGHKMCGPTGTGCLIGRYELLEKMDPFVSGGGNNVDFSKSCDVSFLNPPYKFEAGTQNLAGILGLRAAIEFLSTLGMENIHQHDQELFDYAISRIGNCDKVKIYNRDSRNGIIAFNIKDTFSQDEATLFNFKGIAIRSGQHCAKMLVNGFIEEPATCRMSTYLYTTKEEIDAFCDVILNGGDILDAYFSD